MLPQSPTCVLSGSPALNFCATDGCKSPAFYCLECPRQACLLSHNHSTNHTKTWDKIVENIMKFIEDPPVPPQFKQIKACVVELEGLAVKVRELAEAYREKMGALLKKCNRRADIDATLTNIRDHDFGAITGDDMCKLSKVINPQGNVSLYTNLEEVEKLLTAQNSKISQVMKMLNEAISFYSDVASPKPIVVKIPSKKQPEGEKESPTEHASAQQLMQEGERLQKANNLPEAIKKTTEAIKVDPTNVQAYHMRGQLYLLSNDLINAIPDFDKAIELSPNSSPPRYYRARCHYQSTAYQKAIVDLKKAIELSSQHHEYYYLLGSAHLKIGELQNALDALNKAIMLHKNYQPYLQRRADIYERLGNQQKALEDRSRISMLKTFNRQ